MTALGLLASALGAVYLTAIGRGALALAIVGAAALIGAGGWLFLHVHEQRGIKRDRAL